MSKTAKDLFQAEKLEWLEKCRQEARLLLLTHSSITSDDVTKRCPRPEYVHRNTTGQIFKHPDFKANGITKSNRVEAKGRWIFKWTLKQSAFKRVSREHESEQLELV